MAGRHRSRNQSIQIIKTATVAAKDCKRVATLQMHVSTLSKPVVVLLLLFITYLCFSANQMFSNMLFVVNVLSIYINRTTRSSSLFLTAL
jgi:hypothetical protein